MGVQPITIPQSLAYVLNNAGDKSGVDFNYLVRTAQRESSMDPDAKAPSSSAVGLFQFLDTTWLQVMKEEGPRLGYQKYADAITTDANGNYTIKDKALRAKVLALREDPQVAADMAAAFTRSNGAYLQQKFGRMPSPGELYIAHFLGPQGAEKMFDAGLQNPDQIAARLFPEAAKANPQIFYSNGHSRTIREVYKALVAQQGGIVAADIQPDSKFASQQMAAGGPRTGAGPGDGSAQQDPSTDEVPSRFSKADMSFTALFSTQAPSGVPTPLIGAEAAAPLMASQGVPPIDPAPTAQPLALMDPGTAIPPEPLAAIDSAMSGRPDNAPAQVGDPFAMPTPLTGLGAAADTQPLALMGDGDVSGLTPPPFLPDASSPQSAPVSDVPQPRILMSPGPHTPNSAFFTQVLAQQPPYQGVNE